jgi:hypothetical protein
MVRFENGVAYVDETWIPSHSLYLLKPIYGTKVGWTIRFSN